MTPWAALSRTLRGAGRTTRRGYVATLEVALADQMQANGHSLAAIVHKDRRIAELEARVKAMKEREAALTSMLISALWQRGQAAHEVRKLTSVADPADAGGGEAA